MTDHVVIGTMAKKTFFEISKNFKVVPRLIFRADSKSAVHFFRIVKTQLTIWETLSKWLKKTYRYTNHWVWGLCAPILHRGVLYSTWYVNAPWLTSPHLSVPLRTFTLFIYSLKLLWHFCQTVCYIAPERGQTKKIPLRRIQYLVIGYP